METVQIVKGSPKEINGVKVSETYADAIDLLKSGKQTYKWEYGDSMFPILCSKEYCRIEPVKSLEEIHENDAVLCVVDHFAMIHMVQKVFDTENKGRWFLITTTTGRPFGITNIVYGKCYSTNIFHE